MTVSMTIAGEKNVDEAIARLRKLDVDLARAFKGGLKAGAAFLARRIADGIWYDTGALEDSIYVQRDIVGVAAPYAGIVEETHPRNRHHIKRRTVEAQSQVTRVVAETTEALAKRGGGPESIRHEFRESPGYIPREEFGRHRKRRANERARKKRGGQ